MSKLRAFGAALLWLAASALSAQSVDMEQARADDDFRWGVRAFQETHFSDAILSFEKALSRKPAWVRPRIWLGSALYKDGFEEEALGEWRQALERDPGNSLLKNRVQMIGFRRGLAREVGPKPQYVVAAEINSGKGKYYPLKRPTAVHTRPDGSAYVVAFGGNEILVLDVNSGVQRVLSGGLKGFDRPYDALELEEAGGGEPYLVVSEYGANRLSRVNLRGDRVKEYGASGSGPGAMLGPQYLAADSSGYLYVTDWGNARVDKFDRQGNFILSFGGPLSGPTGIAVREGQVFVADRSGQAIHCFDPSGNYLASYGQGRLSGPEGIAFRDPGTLLVADGNRILALRVETDSWETLADLSGEAGRIAHLSPSPNGDLYAVDFDRNSILILSEMSNLYTGLAVQVERIVSTGFPEIFVDVSVLDRWGAPVVGLKGENFLLTERLKPVNAPQLVRSNVDPAPLDAVLLVEKSLAMKEFREELGRAVEETHARLAGSKAGELEVVSAGEKPAVEAAFGSTRLTAVQAATGGPWAPRWNFERAVRLAVAQLAPRYTRKAVILLTRGELAAEAFSEFSLSQVARYLANNDVAFYAVSFTPALSDELAYLCAETGGRSYRYFQPRGIDDLVPTAVARRGSTYTLKYRSWSDPGFGRIYFDVQVEATLARRSGRAESGYFAPLSD
jgi:DNA-binding beta-propeller fold protein YncE